MRNLSFDYLPSLVPALDELRRFNLERAKEKEKKNNRTRNPGQ